MRFALLFQESLCSNDTVLVVDDFLATGTTGVALHRLAEQAGAQVAGMAFLVEKRFQDGRGAFCHPKNHMHHEQYRRKARSLFATRGSWHRY